MPKDKRPDFIPAEAPDFIPDSGSSYIEDILAGATGLGKAPPAWLEAITSTIPWLGAAGGAAIGATAGLPTGPGATATGAFGAGIGMGAGEAGRQLLMRSLGYGGPPTSEAAASKITEALGIGALTETVGAGLPQVIRGARQLLGRWPTAGARIRGVTEIQEAIRTAARGGEESGIQVGAQTRLAELKAQHALAGQKLAGQQAEELAAREATYLKEAGARPVTETSQLLPEARLARETQQVIRKTRVLLPRRVESLAYREAYDIADELGLRFNLSQSTKAARKIIEPEVLSAGVGAPSVKPGLLKVAGQITQRAENPIAPAIEQAAAQSLFGVPVENLTVAESSALHQALARSNWAGGPIPQSVSGFSLEEIHRLAAATNQAIEREVSVAGSEGSPTLRALQKLKEGLDADISRGMESQPELADLWTNAKAVTTERKAYAALPEVRAHLGKYPKQSPETLLAKLASEKAGPATISTERILSGLRIAPATREALTRYEDMPGLARFLSRTQALADRAKRQIASRGVTKVLNAGIETPTLEGAPFNANKALTYLDTREGLKAQLGSELYGTFRQELQNQIVAQMTHAAETNILKDGYATARQALKESQAKELAGEFGKFLKKVSGSDSPVTAIDRIGTSVERAREAANLLKSDPHKMGALARQIIDNAIDRAGSKEGAFNAAQFYREYIRIRPSIAQLAPKEVLGDLDLLADTLNKITVRMVYGGKASIGISEGIPGLRGTGLRAWGLGKSVTEAIWNEPGTEFAIRPRHILAISKDPRMILLFKRLEETEPATAAHKLAAYGLALSLKRAGFEPERTKQELLMPKE